MGIPAKVRREVKSKHGRAQHAPVGTTLHYKQCAAQMNEGQIFLNSEPTQIKEGRVESEKSDI